MQQSGQRRDPRRVLVVDDDAAIRDMLDLFLTDEGFNVLVAPHGADALAIALRHRPDVILLDWVMPTMGGLEFCREYYNRGGQAHIVIVTGEYVRPEELAPCRAVALITKPFNIEAILEVLGCLS